MLVRFTKQPPAAAADTLVCVRVDGSVTEGALPRQGVLPHDAIHFVVETTLGWHDALFGHLARGNTHAATVQKLHAANIDWSKNVQALQCESLVDCFQAEQWAGASDPIAFVEQLLLGCRRRGVAPPDLTADELAAVRRALREFGAAWRPLLPGRSLERTF